MSGYEGVGGPVEILVDGKYLWRGIVTACCVLFSSLGDCTCGRGYVKTLFKQPVRFVCRVVFFGDCAVKGRVKAAMLGVEARRVPRIGPGVVPTVASME